MDNSGAKNANEAKRRTSIPSSHFTDEETNVQREEAIDPKIHL